MACSGTPDKCADISNWLDEHGAAHSGSWLVLDDGNIVPGATLRTDALDGLDPRDAAAAVGTWAALIPGWAFVRLPKAT
jgi:hypothetical protein